jgi:glutathione peroxidase
MSCIAGRKTLLATAAFGSAATMASPYDFTVKDIDGNEVDLAQYKGKVVLVVNVASQCGKYAHPLDLTLAGPCP